MKIRQKEERSDKLRSFFVFTKEKIEKLLDGKKSISLKRLEVNGVKPVLAQDLKKAINN